MSLREGRLKLKEGNASVAMVFFKKARFRTPHCAPLPPSVKHEIEQLLVTKGRRNQARTATGPSARRTPSQALMISKRSTDRVQQRRAIRGLAAAKRMQASCHGGERWHVSIVASSTASRGGTGMHRRRETWRAPSPTTCRCCSSARPWVTSRHAPRLAHHAGPAAAALCSHLDANRGGLHSKQGDTDALGAVADLYTETGDLERAGRYYDLYIAAISSGLSSNNVD